MTMRKTKRTAAVPPTPGISGLAKRNRSRAGAAGVLIDTKLRLVASPLTESVQIRVVTTEMPALTDDVLQKAINRRPPAEWQSSLSSNFEGLISSAAWQAV